MARKMQESGINWIGDLPATWQLRRFKNAGNFQTGKDHKELAAGEIPVFGSSSEPFAWVGRSLCSRKAIAIGRKGTIDQPFLIQTKFWAVDTCMFNTVLRTDFSLNYLAYWSQIVPWKEISTQTALPSLTQTDANNVIVAYPPINEQRRIADWLDLQTTRIDKRRALLAKKRELLQELNKSMVHEKVCQGANQSGEMVRIKEVAKINPPTRLPLFGSVEFYPMDAIGVDGGLAAGQFKDVSAATGYSQFKNDDVIFAKVTPCFENGKSAIAQGLTTQAALATTEVIVLRSNKKISPQFLHYRLKARDFADMGESEMKGAGGLKRVPEKHVANFCFVLPNKNEQQAIIDFLDRKKSQINRQITLIDQLDDLLQQQRKALIHEAVTGKIDLSH